MDSELYNKIISSITTTGIGLVVFYVFFFILKKWSNAKKHYIPALIEKHLHLAGVVFFIIITLNIDIRNFIDYLTTPFYNTISHALSIAVIISFGWLGLKIVALFKEIVITHVERQERKDFRLRSVKTQFQLIQRVINLTIVVGTTAAVLMTFSQIRELGSTILASAGVAGLILGIAAQKSLGSIFAGVQIAISQPVKLEDTVVVEGKFGTVGEITLTYIVINVWDGKRLIVPISYFLDKPFENWTRVSSEVIGKITLYTDLSFPVNNLRKEFEKKIKDNPLWDQRKASLFVTDLTDSNMQIQATMSAKDSDDAFHLECFMREELSSYIKKYNEGSYRGGELRR